MNWFAPSKKESPQKPWLSAAEITIFAMLGTMMFVSKIVMEWLPNIHLLGMLTMVYTLVYRKKALIPIYIFVLINAVYNGFSPWLVPYFYIWTILWGVTMLLPKKMSVKMACVVYPVVCALHGLLFGVMYAPVQAIMFHMNFQQTLAWIGAGLYFDLVHGLGNLGIGLLILPLTKLIRKLDKRSFRP